MPRKPSFGFNLPPLPKKAYEILRHFQGGKDTESAKWKIPQIEVITAALIALDRLKTTPELTPWDLADIFQEAKRLCGTS